MAPIEVHDFDFTEHAIEALDRLGIRPADLYSILTEGSIVKCNGSIVPLLTSSSATIGVAAACANDEKGPIVTATLRFESLDEPLNEEERALMDPAAWDWETEVEADNIAPDLGAILRVRFTSDEVVALVAAARTEGANAFDFIDQSVLDRIGMTADANLDAPRSTLASRR